MSPSHRALGAALLALGCQSTAPARLSAGAGEGRLAVGAADPCRAEPDEPPPAPGLLPVKASGFCLDPHGLVRSYAVVESEQLARACERVLGSGCSDGDVERGLERVLAARYLDSSGEGRADVIASEFADSAQAFGAFSERLLGDRDPSELGAQAFEAPGVAVLDAELVLAWQGRHVLSIRYSNSELPPDDESTRARSVLPELARGLLANVPADRGLPRSVEKLPARQRLPLGVHFLDSDAFGVPAIGQTAIGHYRDGEKRWRVMASARPDFESAKDVLSTLRRHPRVRKIKGAPLDAVELTVRRLPSEPEVSWVIGQWGDMIYGIGDEPNALPEFMSARAEASVKLSQHEKLVALTRVQNK